MYNFFVLQKQVDIDGAMDPVKYWKIALSINPNYRKVKRVPDLAPGDTTLILDN